MKLRMLVIIAGTAVPAAAFSQPYVSANLGWASGEFPIEAAFNGLVDDSAPAYGIDLGLGFGDKWAVELGVNGYGNLDGRAAPCAAGTACVPPVVTEESVDQTIYEAALTRRFTIRNLRLYGKAGYYHANIDTDVPFEDSDFSESGLLLGIGLRWYFDAPWSVSLEATRFDDNVSQVSVGFGWGLGLKNTSRSEPIGDDNER
jgi:opacity protein-like surface antigen